MAPSKPTMFKPIEYGDYVFTLTLEEDNLKLFLEAEVFKHPPGEHYVLLPFRFDKFKDLIIAAVPRAILDEAVLLDMGSKLTVRELPGKRRIAKGKPSIPGADGKLLLLVKHIILFW